MIVGLLWNRFLPHMVLGAVTASCTSCLPKPPADVEGSGPELDMAGGRPPTPSERRAAMAKLIGEIAILSQYCSGQVHWRGQELHGGGSREHEGGSRRHRGGSREHGGGTREHGGGGRKHGGGSRKHGGGSRKNGCCCPFTHLTAVLLQKSLLYEL